jgi:hypothetical protein
VITARAAALAIAAAAVLPAAAGCAPSPAATAHALPRDPEAPPGWVAQPIVDGRFQVYGPPDRDALPPPLAWVPCRDPELRLRACRELAPPGGTGDGNAIGGQPFGYADGDGRVVLQLRHIYDRGPGRYAAMALVAEADGPVRQALWVSTTEAGPRGVALLQGGVAPGRAAWRLIDWDARPARWAAIGGADTALRPSLFAPFDAQRGGVWAGARWAAETRTGSAHVIDWSDGRVVATPWIGGDASAPAWAGDVMFFSHAGPTDSDLWLWTPERGAVRLRGSGGDPGRGVGALGTDGKDLVWLEGSGRRPRTPGDARSEDDDNDDVFPTRAIYTAPFVTDPLRLQPRRLRRWEPALISSSRPPVVGCGHAVFPWPAGAQHGLLVVRLRDGQAFPVPDPPAAGAAAWQGAVAVTCDEVFAYTANNLRRFPLAALGPGLAPD